MVASTENLAYLIARWTSTSGLEVGDKKGRGYAGVVRLIVVDHCNYYGEG